MSPKSGAIPQDPVAQAIDNVAQPIQQRLNAEIPLSTGRVTAVNVPMDLTPAELVELIGHMTTGLVQQLKLRNQAANPLSRLVLPRS